MSESKIPSFLPSRNQIKRRTLLEYTKQLRRDGLTQIGGGNNVLPTPQQINTMSADRLVTWFKMMNRHCMASGKARRYSSLINLTTLLEEQSGRGRIRRSGIAKRDKLIRAVDNARQTDDGRLQTVLPPITISPSISDLLRTSAPTPSGGSLSGRLQSALAPPPRSSELELSSSAVIRGSDTEEFAGGRVIGFERGIPVVSQWAEIEPGPSSAVVRGIATDESHKLRAINVGGRGMVTPGPLSAVARGIATDEFVGGRSMVTPGSLMSFEPSSNVLAGDLTEDVLNLIDFNADISESDVRRVVKSVSQMLATSKSKEDIALFTQILDQRLNDLDIHNSVDNVIPDISGLVQAVASATGLGVISTPASMLPSPAIDSLVDANAGASLKEAGVKATSPGDVPIGGADIPDSTTPAEVWDEPANRYGEGKYDDAADVAIPTPTLPGEQKEEQTNDVAGLPGAWANATSLVYGDGDENAASALPEDEVKSAFDAVKKIGSMLAEGVIPPDQIEQAKAGMQSARDFLSSAGIDPENPAGSEDQSGVNPRGVIDHIQTQVERAIEGRASGRRDRGRNGEVPRSAPGLFDEMKGINNANGIERVRRATNFGRRIAGMSSMTSTGKVDEAKFDAMLAHLWKVNPLMAKKLKGTLKIQRKKPAHISTKMQRNQVDLIQQGNARYKEIRDVFQTSYQ